MIAILPSWDKSYHFWNPNGARSNVEEEFNKYFVEPLKVFGLDEESYVAVLNIMSDYKACHIFCYLTAIATYKQFDGLEGLESSIGEFVHDNLVYWAFLEVCNTIHCVYVNREGKVLVDDAVDVEFTLLSQHCASDQYKRDFYLRHLSNNNPLNLTDDELDTVQLLVQHELIQPDDLCKVDFCDNTGKKATVNALEISKQPLRFVRKDLLALPHSILHEHGDNYFETLIFCTKLSPYAFSPVTIRWIEKHADDLRQAIKQGGN